MSRSKELFERALLTLMAGCALIVTSLLVREKLFQRVSEFPPLTATRVDNWSSVIAGGQRMGSNRASTTLVIYEDFQCPACKRFALDVLKPITAKYGGDFAVVHKHWPLGYHPLALGYAKAAECAAQQGRFDRFHEAVYKAQEQLSQLSVAHFVSISGVADSVEFLRCSEGRAVEQVIEEHVAQVKAFGARGTPAIVVDGMSLSRIPTLDELDSIIRSRAGATTSLVP